MITEDKIVRSFIEDKTPKTIRAISKHIKSDYRISYTATQRLLDKNILLSTTVGKSTLCELNETYYGIEIYNAEEKRKASLLQKSNIKQLYKEIMNKVENHFFIFLVFGSYAKGKQNKSSDIDIMFISNDQDFEERISEILSLLPLKIHFSVFTEKEFIKMKNSRQSNVVKEAIENNVILYGIESYYQMKHA